MLTTRRAVLIVRFSIRPRTSLFWYDLSIFASGKNERPFYSLLYRYTKNYTELKSKSIFGTHLATVNYYDLNWKHPDPDIIEASDRMEYLEDDLMEDLWRYVTWWNICIAVIILYFTWVCILFIFATIILIISK